MRPRGRGDSTGMAPIGGSALHTVHCSALRAFVAGPRPSALGRGRTFDMRPEKTTFKEEQ